MPFYEYQCNNCGQTLEAMQKITEPPLKKCPHCGKSQLQQAHVGAGVPVEGRRLVRDRFQIGSGQQAQPGRSAGGGCAQGRQEGDDRGAGSKETGAADAAKPEKSADKSADKAADSGNKAAARRLRRRGRRGCGHVPPGGRLRLE